MEAVFLQLHDGLAEAQEPKWPAALARMRATSSGDSPAGIVAPARAGMEHQGVPIFGGGPHMDPARGRHVFAIATLALYRRRNWS